VVTNRRLIYPEKCLNIEMSKNPYVCGISYIAGAATAALFAVYLSTIPANREYEELEPAPIADVGTNLKLRIEIGDAVEGAISNQLVECSRANDECNSQLEKCVGAVRIGHKALSECLGKQGCEDNSFDF